MGTRTYKHIADPTGTHPGTVRRYLPGQSMSVEFITSLCQALLLNPQRVLTGHGPMLLDGVRGHELRTADPSDLLGAATPLAERPLLEPTAVPKEPAAAPIGSRTLTPNDQVWPLIEPPRRGVPGRPCGCRGLTRAEAPIGGRRTGIRMGAPRGRGGG